MSADAMRDAKNESEGRPTDTRHLSGRTPEARAHAQTAAAPDRRNERARASRLTARLRAAIIAFLAGVGESPRESESATLGAQLLAAASRARAEHPMAAA
ncbi:hypothetical protein [Caballeronia sp. M1242]|uniref:hypothetical protein n=1 Tax=Caballeronia sp. M1242 TaxID=2814653 RepID=UPI0019CFA7C2|nr:hypothetical protein [Caballeronia sp. M1242]QSN62015.1 hypothetical protein JYK05_03725 [Caballeronia sp. M1242]